MKRSLNWNYPRAAGYGDELGANCQFPQVGLGCRLSDQGASDTRARSWQGRRVIPGDSDDDLAVVTQKKPYAMNEIPTAEVLHRLMKVIEDRRQNPPPRSYTTSLFAGGVEKIGEKIVEEGAEVVEAAGESGEEGRQHLIREAADLLYHLFVLLAHREVGLSEVEACLASRAGVSGLDEKESRKQ